MNPFHQKLKTSINLQSLKQQTTCSSNSIKIDLGKTTQAHRVIYPLAKHNKDAYNEAYQFLTKKNIPLRFLPLEKHQKSFQNWKKDITKNYSIDKVSTCPSTVSRLRFKRLNKEEVFLPFQDEISKIIEQHHTGFFLEAKKHFGEKIKIQNIIQSGLYWAKMGKMYIITFLLAPIALMQNMRSP